MSHPRRDANAPAETDPTMTSSQPTVTPPASMPLPATPASSTPAQAPAWRRRPRALTWPPAPHHLALTAVLALAAVLDVYRLSQNGYANIFYSAGVKSMLRSLHNFVFVSFDPGGLIMVDKPPLGLWLQAASAKLFGFSPLSLLLPEAIVGVLTVALLYRVLARRVGPWAGIAAALALAVFPSFVAISRTNNVDAILILLMLLACDASLRAIETGRSRPLLWSAALVGLAFNTKTLAADLVVPGIALAYLLCAPGSVTRRMTQLLAAGAVLLVVSFSWIALVELTPASKRPYVGSSTNNTELGLTFSYNGFGRVGGQVGGPGRIPFGTGALAHAGSPPAARTPPAGARHARVHHTGRESQPIAFGGPAGPLRLFGRGLGDQGAWLLPLALAGLVAFALLTLGRGRRLRDPRLAVLLVLGGWFLAEAAVLSLSKGIVHPYYVSALGPGVAAMTGVGLLAFAELARQRDWRLLLLPVAVAVTVPVQIHLLHKVNYMPWFAPLLIAGAGLGVAALLVRRIAIPAIAFTLGLLLIAPTVYSASTWLAPVESTFPAAGPRQAAGAGGVGIGSTHLLIDKSLIRYIRAHRHGRTWAVLTDAADTAAPFIFLGLDAGALGGYSGIDPALDGRGLARLVARGQARYVLLGGQFSTRGGNRATAAVLRACRQLPTTAWLDPSVSPFGLVLFDCQGREAPLSAA